MQLYITPMTEEDAHRIASWHYDAPYDFYDMDNDPDDLAELLNPQNWKDVYFSVQDEQNELIGFFSYRRVNNETVEIGLGLRPDCTGKGFGSTFVCSGVTFAQTHRGYRKVRLSVATFNRRAIRVYEQVGFVPVETFMQQTNGSEYEFLSMVRQL